MASTKVTNRLKWSELADHLNANHPATCLAYAWTFAKQVDAVEAKLTSIDAWRMFVECTKSNGAKNIACIVFEDVGLTKTDDLQQRLVEMHGMAMKCVKPGRMACAIPMIIVLMVLAFLGVPLWAAFVQSYILSKQMLFNLLNITALAHVMETAICCLGLHEKVGLRWSELGSWAWYTLICGFPIFSRAVLLQKAASKGKGKGPPTFQNMDKTD